MLRNLLPTDWHCHQDYSTLRELTIWAIEGRYPSLMDEPTQVVAQAALDLAQGVLVSVQSDLTQRGFP